MNKVINVSEISKGNHSQKFVNKSEFDLPDITNLLDIKAVIKNPIPKDIKPISNKYNNKSD